LLAVITQVAAPLLSVAVEEQEATPDGVETLQVTVPVGVTPEPETAAVKVMVLPTFVSEELVTLLVGVALLTVSLTVLEFTGA
jgi:hypothetical protein